MICVAIGDRIKQFRLAQHPPLTQEGLARRAGISRAALAHYEREARTPSIETARSLSRVLGVSVDELVAEDKLPEEARVTAASRFIPASGVMRRSLRSETTGRIKVYGAVSAGRGGVANLDDDYLDVPIEFAREDYAAMVVEGDSMLPLLEPSDLAIFKDHRAQKVGYVMVCRLMHSGDWVVKLMVYENGMYKLRSLNNSYPDITEGYEIFGFLVGMIRDNGPERTIRLNPYGLK